MKVMREYENDNEVPEEVKELAGKVNKGKKDE